MNFIFLVLVIPAIVDLTSASVKPVQKDVKKNIARLGAKSVIRFKIPASILKELEKRDKKKYYDNNDYEALRGKTDDEHFLQRNLEKRDSLLENMYLKGHNSERTSLKRTIRSLSNFREMEHRLS